MSLDASEVEKLRHDLGQVSLKGVEEIAPAMKRAGVEMKKGMQRDFSGSRHFRQVARSITFDVSAVSGFGVRNYQVEVGPDASRDSSAALAGIAYFGTSRGGGASVPDPVKHAEKEADAVAKIILEAVGRAL